MPRRAPLTALAAVVAGVSLAAAAVNVADYARLAQRLAERPQPFVRGADIDPLAYFVPTAALAGARDTIPPGATYSIVAAEPPDVADPALIRIVFRVWLVPRRYTDEPRQADWVIAYRRSSESLGLAYSEETGVAPSVQVVRVQR